MTAINPPTPDRDLRTWGDDLDRIAAQTQRPLPTCEGCRHFQPDVINPVEGMGRCLHQARHGYWHATVLHRCPDHEPKGPPADD